MTSIIPTHNPFNINSVILKYNVPIDGSAIGLVTDVIHAIFPRK